MSIANISSENKVSGGTNAEFEISMKKPLQRVIGLQLLNATIPLSYNIINAENHKVIFEVLGNDVAARNGEYTANLEYGTYSPDEMAKELTDQLNIAAGFPNPCKSQSFYDAIVSNKDFAVTIDAEKFNTVRSDIPNIISGYSYETDFTGWEIKSGGVTHLVNAYDRTTHTMYYNSGNSSIVLTGSNAEVHYQGILVIYDDERNAFVIGIDSGMVGMSTANPERMRKTIGFSGLENVIAVVNMPSYNRYKHFGSYVLVGWKAPELAGPNLLFLRIGGDALLDQQNSEDSMNDRIPIPVDQPHGGVVHYENDAESDVIPFSVPCDVSRLKFRLEYGDDNEIVGGKIANLRGHEMYVRLKFYKQHQQGGKKM